MNGWPGFVEAKSSPRLTLSRTGRRSLQRGGGDERVEQRPLPAERAAERRLDDPDGARRDPERLRDLVARPEQRLGRGLDDEPAVLVGPGRADLRLEVALVDPARREPALADRGRSREARGDVAVAVAMPPRDVRRQVLGRRSTRPRRHRRRRGSGRPSSPRDRPPRRARAARGATRDPSRPPGRGRRAGARAGPRQAPPRPSRRRATRRPRGRPARRRTRPRRARAAGRRGPCPSRGWAGRRPSGRPRPPASQERRRRRCRETRAWARCDRTRRA